MKLKAHKIDRESATTCWWEISADLDIADLRHIRSFLDESIEKGSAKARLFIREHKDELLIGHVEVE